MVNPPPKQEVDAGAPLSLTLAVEDDGNPRPRVDRGASVAGLKGAPAERPLNDSLRVSWVQWRGPGIAKFDPKVIRVVDGKATTKITFDKPGNYVLRAYAEDASIHTPHDVSVTVRPPPVIVSRFIKPRRDSSAMEGVWLEIKRFSIGQAAKFMGVLYLLFGLLFVPFFLLIGMFAPDGQGAFGTMFALAMPVMYACMGVVGGAIGAALYNLVAGWVGGIEVELDRA